MTPNVATSYQTINGVPSYVINDITIDPPSTGGKTVQIQAWDNTLLYNSGPVLNSQNQFVIPVGADWNTHMWQLQITVVLVTGGVYTAFSYLLPSTLNLRGV